jgi:hypothetical protein
VQQALTELGLGSLEAGRVVDAVRVLERARAMIDAQTRPDRAARTAAALARAPAALTKNLGSVNN